jgi:hypothetical protein
MQEKKEKILQVVRCFYGWNMPRIATFAVNRIVSVAVRLYSTT